MIDEQEANALIKKLLELRSSDSKAELKKHETICVEKFKYLVAMKTNKYKSFSNYDDLNQEGYEALLKAISTFNPKKGNFFAWAHNYIGTKISRSANLHTTIRYPLKVAKEQAPHKEIMMPLLIDNKRRPDLEMELAELHFAMENANNFLNEQDKKIIDLTFGLNGDKPMSVNKICNKIGITRSIYARHLSKALDILKQNIKI